MLEDRIMQLCVYVCVYIHTHSHRAGLLLLLLLLLFSLTVCFLFSLQISIGYNDLQFCSGRPCDRIKSSRTAIEWTLWWDCLVKFACTNTPLVTTWHVSYLWQKTVYASFSFKKVGYMIWKDVLQKKTRFSTFNHDDH